MPSTHKQTLHSKKVQHRRVDQASHQPCASPHPRQHAQPAGSHLLTNREVVSKERAAAKQQIAPALIYNTQCHSHFSLRTNTTGKITALQVKGRGELSLQRKGGRTHTRAHRSTACTPQQVATHGALRHTTHLPSSTYIRHLCVNREATTHISDTQNLSLRALWVPGGRQCSWQSIIQRLPAFCVSPCSNSLVQVPKVG